MRLVREGSDPQEGSWWALDLLDDHARFVPAPRLSVIPLDDGAGACEKPQDRKRALGLVSSHPLSDLPAPDVLAPWALIVVDFSAFTDGRGFSLARHLRERSSFSGALIARGVLIPDQRRFLREVGFSHVWIEQSLLERHSRQAWERPKSLVALRYQSRTSTGSR